MKTNELSGPALDWAVAKAEGHYAAVAPGTGLVIIRRGNVTDYFDPAINWSWAGPIIEREKLMIWPITGYVDENFSWSSRVARLPASTGATCHGHTPLEAAMRCYVTIKLGGLVAIPKGLQ